MQTSAPKENPVRYIQTYEDLQPGDVIIFSASNETSAKAISTLQKALFTQTKGHADSTHCALYVGTHAGKHQIAHVAGKGYKVETLEEYSTLDRAFLVYRPNDKEMANNITVAALDEKNKMTKEYSFTSVIKTAFTISALDPRRKPTQNRYFATAAMCAEFVIRTLKQASNSEVFIERLYLPDLRSISSPRALEGYLNVSPLYSKGVYTGKPDPYEFIKQTINKTLDKLESGSKKYQDNIDYFRKAIAVLDADSTKNNLIKAQYLLKGMLPLLDIHRNRIHGKHTVSYNDVKEAAKKLRIFPKDIPPRYKNELDKMVAEHPMLSSAKTLPNSSSQKSSLKTQSSSSIINNRMRQEQKKVDPASSESIRSFKNELEEEKEQTRVKTEKNLAVFDKAIESLKQLSENNNEVEEEQQQEEYKGTRQSPR